MVKEQAFQPGRFSPVVEIAQRDSGLPAAADTNFVGISEVAENTLSVARAASRGFGSQVADPTPAARLALIFGYLLAARNSVEQLLHVGVFTRLTTVLKNAQVSPLEPLVRAYNYFGHFELDGKTYVTRGLERVLIECVFNLRKFATADVADAIRYTETPGNIQDIDLDFYHLSSEGEIVFGKLKPLKDTLMDLVKYISSEDFNLSNDEKLPLLKYLLDVSTESGLNNFLRTARTYSGFTPPGRDFASEPTAAHKAAMKKLFGSEFSSANDTIPITKFTGSITLAYNTLRRVSVEHSYAMKTIPIPKYEGGSAAQLAALVDDVLVSQVPLSLSDSTAATAFTTSYGVNRSYKSAPNLERNELLRELISQSLLPVR